MSFCNKQRIQRAILLSLALLLLFWSGCNTTEQYYVFKVEGSVSLPKGTKPTGKIIVEMYHKESGTGTLKQPLLFVTSWTPSDPSALSKEVTFPVLPDRTGLVVYAWHDRNGDGALCQPTKQDEEAGAIVVNDFPTRTVRIKLELGQMCAGPEAFYP